MKKPRNIAFGILAVIITMLIFFAILELTLRLVTDKKVKVNPVILRYSDNKELIYELTPNAAIYNSVNITINSKGTRDYEYSFVKQANTTRIAVLGDSIAFGMGLNITDSFPKVLENRLNENSDGKFQVINFGVPGYGTKEELEMLKAKALKFDPDIIIISYALNDPEISTSLQSYFSQNPRNGTRICRIHSIGIPISCGSRDFIDSLAISDFVYSKLLNIKDNFQGDYFTRVHKDEKLWGNAADSFNEIRKISDKNDIKVIMVIFPVLYDLDDYKWEWVHEMVRNESDKNGFIFIDLLEAYSKYEAEELRASKDDLLHPNKKGHEIAAEEIYEFLEEGK